MGFILNKKIVKRVLDTVDAGLTSGLGRPRPGHMCVEAAVCFALGLPHGDNPDCVDPGIRLIKIRLNDSSWSSKTVRAAGMRRLAVLQLGTRYWDFDQAVFAQSLVLETVNSILPIALSGYVCSALLEKLRAATTPIEANEALNCMALQPVGRISIPNIRLLNTVIHHLKEAIRYSKSDYRPDQRQSGSETTKAVEKTGLLVSIDRAGFNKVGPKVIRLGHLHDAVLLLYASTIERILVGMDVPAASFLPHADGKWNF